MDKKKEPHGPFTVRQLVNGENHLIMKIWDDMTDLDWESAEASMRDHIKL